MPVYCQLTTPRVPHQWPRQPAICSPLLFHFVSFRENCVPRVWLPRLSFARIADLRGFIFERVTAPLRNNPFRNMCVSRLILSCSERLDTLTTARFFTRRSFIINNYVMIIDKSYLVKRADSQLCRQFRAEVVNWRPWSLALPPPLRQWEESGTRVRRGNFNVVGRVMQ